jgi:hypothetical protein
MFDFLVRFQAMDRRWIFLGMAIAIVLPLLFPFKMPFRVDERVQALFDEVDRLPAGSRVLVSADFDPGSRPEIEPFYRANLHHLFRKDVKIVVLTLWESAPPLVQPILEEIAGIYGKTYGEDYVFLGYKAGREVAIKSIGADIPKTFPSDSRGTPVERIPVMRGIQKAADFALIVNVSSGNPGTKEYVMQIQGQYNLKLASSTTAVSGPDYIPFYKAGQLFGLAAGMPGSAQYEKLTFPDGKVPGGGKLMATASMDVLNLGHLYIMALILFGNLAYFITRRRD